MRNIEFERSRQNYIVTEAREIADIAGREVRNAMQPGVNIGFDPELKPIQIRNAMKNIDRKEFRAPGYVRPEADDARRRRALHNWLVMYRAHKS